MVAVEQGVKSLILLPITARDRMLGMLSLISVKTGHFTADRVQLLTGIADGLGIFLENAELNEQVSLELELRRRSEEQLRQQTEDLEALLGFARVAIGPGSLEEKLTSILEALRRISATNEVALRVPDPDNGSLVLVAETGDSDMTGRPKALTRGVSVKAFDLGEAVIANDYPSSPDHIADTVAKGANSMMALPVKTGHSILAIVVLISKHRYDFSPQLIARITSLGEGIGVLLENARLNHEVTFKEDLEQRRDTFVSVAFHEIRTPMAVIEGYSELLLNKTLPEHIKQESLERIHRNARSLSAIVDDMLNVSRIHSGKLTLDPKHVSLANLLAEVAASLEPIYVQHQIYIEIGAQVPPVFADVDKLNQILTNLVDNALKYSPDGGDITITATHDPKRDWVVVAIADEGLGIPPEDREGLFELFHRIRRPETAGIKGSGLGLYIVKEMLDLLNGEIWVESELGKGSTFFVSLPTK